MRSLGDLTKLHQISERIFVLLQRFLFIQVSDSLCRRSADMSICVPGWCWRGSTRRGPHVVSTSTCAVGHVFSASFQSPGGGGTRQERRSRESGILTPNLRAFLITVGEGRRDFIHMTIRQGPITKPCQRKARGGQRRMLSQ